MKDYNKKSRKDLGTKIYTAMCYALIIGFIAYEIYSIFNPQK